MGVVSLSRRGVVRGGSARLRWWLVLWVLSAGLWASGEADPSWATSPTDEAGGVSGGAGDYHVNAWWAAVSDNGANELDADRVFNGSEVLIHAWVHVATTGQDGLAETTLLPGDIAGLLLGFVGERLHYE